MFETFDNYVMGFDISDNAIRRKYEHSYRVMNIAKDIAGSEKMGEDDIQIVTVAGLFHDYGRFSQWRDYRTFSDRKSIDHADLGVKLLFEEREIETFVEKRENFDEIYDAIKYHNKLAIPEGLSEHNKKICRVIRDADKLDILYLLGKGDFDFESSSDEVSILVDEAFRQERLVDVRDIKNKNDNIVKTLAFIYDLNYGYSYEYILDNALLDRLFERISDKDLLRGYFDKIYEYVYKKAGK